MPRNLSAWIDICIHLAVILLLVLVVSSYNLYVGAIGFLVWICMLAFARERCRARRSDFSSYCQNIIRNVNEVSNYAVERLPQAVLIVDADGRPVRLVGVNWFGAESSEFVVGGRLRSARRGRRVADRRKLPQRIREGYGRPTASAGGVGPRTIPRHDTHGRHH